MADVRELPENIRSQIALAVGGHWRWTGALHAYGYAYGFADGRTRHLTKWVWEQYNGPVPEGMMLNHCQMRACINPDHQQASATRRVKTHCKRGHPFTEANTLVKPDGSRACRVCDRERKRVQRANQQFRQAEYDQRRRRKETAS